MPRDPSEIRAEIARRKAEANITRPGVADDALRSVGNVGGAVADAGMEALPEIASPSNIGGMVGGVVGATRGSPKIGAGVGTAIGRSVESALEGDPVGVVTSIPIGFAEGYASEVFGDKMSRLWRGVKSKVFRKAPVGSPPAEGSLFGKPVAEAKELHEFGKFMGRELERDAVALRAASGEPPLTPREIERMKQGFFTPAQLTEGDLLDQLEAAGGSSMTGGKMRRFKRTRDKALNAYADTYVRGLGEVVKDPVVLGKFLKTKTEAVFNDKKKNISAAYEYVMDLAGDRVVSLEPVRNAMGAEIADWEARAAVSPDRQQIAPIINRIKAMVVEAKDPLTGDVVEVPRQLTIRQLQSLRSDWSEARRLLKDTKSKAKGTTTGALREIDSLMDSELRAASADLGLTGKDTLDRKLGAARFSRARVQGQMDRLQMEKVVDLVDRKKAGIEAIRELMPDDISTRNVDLLRNVLGGESNPAWGKVRAWYGTHLLDKHRGNGTLNFQGLLDDLTKSNDGRLAQIKSVLGNEQYDRLRRFAQVGAEARRGNPVGSKVAINIAETGALLRFAEIGALAGLVGGAAGAFGDSSKEIGVGGAASIFVPMAILNRWLSNPKTADLVLTGMKGNGGLGFTREVSALLARTIAEEGMDSGIEPLPSTGTRQDIRQQKAAIGGIRG